MKATPEDVAKKMFTPGRDREGVDASMKATPEDVAKSEAVGRRVAGTNASMKATPEDVAKPKRTRHAWSRRSRLNEGHARRRGEGNRH